jgi:hypothetical protein
MLRFARVHRDACPDASPSWVHGGVVAHDTAGCRSLRTTRRFAQILPKLEAEGPQLVAEGPQLVERGRHPLKESLTCSTRRWP